MFSAFLLKLTKDGRTPHDGVQREDDVRILSAAAKNDLAAVELLTLHGASNSIS